MSNNIQDNEVATLQADVSGVAKQFSKESKESNQLFLAIQEEQQIILRMTKYAEEIQDMQNRFKSCSIQR
jgi:hypothetical protein